MARKSIRKSYRSKPRCANCNSICFNERSFSSALPRLPQSFEPPVTKGKGDITEAGDAPQWSNGNLDMELLLDKKPQLEVEEDGTVRTKMDEDEYDNNESISILDALLKIFRFHWKCQKRLLMSTKMEQDMLTICTHCAYSLSKMYDGYTSFTESTLEAGGKSYLSSLIFPRNGHKNRPEKEKFRKKSRRIDESDEDTDIALGTIKTSFTGDLKELAACKVEVTKLTFESASALAEANDSTLCIPEHMTLFGLETTKEEVYPSWDEVEDEDKYVLSMVNTDTDPLKESTTSKYFTRSTLSSTSTTFLRPQRRRRRTSPALLLDKKPRRPRGVPSNVTECHRCGKQLRTNVLLRQHMQVYHQENYNCQYCSERHSDRKELKEHLNLCHDDEKTEQCKICSRKYFTRLELKKHGRIHLNRQSVTCSICNGTFPSDRHLKAHQLTHTEGQPELPIFVCPVEDCNKRYTRAQFLNNHIRYLHDRRGLFACTFPGCEKSFGTESYLNAHIVSHESTGTHLCELCGKNYKHKKDLRIHEQRNHSQVSNKEELKEFKCGVCPKRYFRADHLRTHRVKANHYVGGQEPALPDVDLLSVNVPHEFKCSTCYKLFVSDMALKTHEQTHVDNEDEADGRKFSCSECNQKYTSMKTLEYHKRYMHQLKGSYSCTICPKSFGRVSSLKRHLSVHSNTQHICGDCNKRYKNKHDLMHHYRREHVLTEMNYEHECGCGKRFYRRDMLRAHVVKTGHVAAKRRIEKTKVEAQPPENAEVSVYVMESGEFLEEEVEMEGEDGSQETEVIMEEQQSAGEMLEVLDQVHEHQHIVHEGLRLDDIVEITGEDAEGTIAHMVLVNADGGTDVIAVVAQENGEIDPRSLAMYNLQLI